MDLVVTNEVNIELMTTRDPLGKGNHLYLEFKYVYSVIIPVSKTVRYLCNKGEYQCFNTKLLDFNWDLAFVN